MTPTGTYLLDWSPRLVFGEQRIGKEDCGQGVVDLDSRAEKFRFLSRRKQGASEDFSPHDPVSHWTEGRGVIPCMAETT